MDRGERRECDERGHSDTSGEAEGDWGLARVDEGGALRLARASADEAAAARRRVVPNAAPAASSKDREPSVSGAVRPCQSRGVWGAGGAAAAAQAERRLPAPAFWSWTSPLLRHQRMSVARVRLGRGRCCVDFFSETTGLEGGRGGGRRDAGAGGGRAGGRGGWARRRARRRCGGRRAAGVVGERGVGWGCRGGERVGAGVGVVV